MHVRVYVFPSILKVMPAWLKDMIKESYQENKQTTKKQNSLSG